MAEYFSKRGLGLLKQRLEAAEAGLKKLQEEKSVAYNLSGDTWHDNPGFNALEQREKREVEAIVEMRRLIQAAQVYPLDSRPCETVGLGSIVRVSRFERVSEELNEHVWEIVGYGEADPPRGRIAYKSPIARGLLGLARGESKVIKTPRSEVELEVLDLYESWEQAGTAGDG